MRLEPFVQSAGSLEVLVDEWVEDPSVARDQGTNLFGSVHARDHLGLRATTHELAQGYIDDRIMEGTHTDGHKPFREKRVDSGLES